MNPVKDETTEPADKTLEETLNRINNEITELEALQTSLTSSLDRLVGYAPEGEGYPIKGCAEDDSFAERLAQARTRLESLRGRVIYDAERLECAV